MPVPVASTSAWARLSMPVRAGARAAGHVCLGGLAALAGVTVFRAATGQLDHNIMVAASLTALALVAVTGGWVGRIAWRHARVYRAVVVDALGSDAQNLSGETDMVGTPGFDAALGVADQSTIASTLRALLRRARVAEADADRARRHASAAAVGVRRVLASLVESEEQSKGQMVAELHDTVAQSLIVAGYFLDDAQVEPAAQQIKEAERHLRDVLAHARPPELQRHDLAAAVTALAADLRMRHNLVVRLHWPDEPTSMPMPYAVILYRYYQETLRNVVKHAGVLEATASLTVDGNDLVAEVRDTGRGFDPDSVSSRGGHHVGLRLLDGRARAARADLQVLSTPGTGTRVILRLPLPVEGDTALGLGRPAGPPRARRPGSVRGGACAAGEDGLQTATAG